MCMYVKVNWMESLNCDHINTCSISILDARNLCYVSVFIPKTPVMGTVVFWVFFGSTLSVWAEFQAQGHFPAEVRVRWRSLRGRRFNFHLDINIERQRQVFEEYFVLAPLFDFCTLNCRGASAVWSRVFSDVPDYFFFSSFSKLETMCLKLPTFFLVH